MVRPGPDTGDSRNVWIKWSHYSGYYYDDTYINAFSHTKMVGAGILNFIFIKTAIILIESKNIKYWIIYKGIIDCGWIGIMPTTIKTKKLHKKLASMVMNQNNVSLYNIVINYKNYCLQ